MKSSIQTVLVVVGFTDVLAVLASLYLRYDRLREQVYSLTLANASLQDHQRTLQGEITRLQRARATSAAAAVTAVASPETAPTASAPRSPESLAIAARRARLQADGPQRFTADRVTAHGQRVILFDGQKLEVDGRAVDETDLKYFPPGSIERLEVLPPASGTADPAVPGAVNVILKEDFQQRVMR